VGETTILPDENANYSLLVIPLHHQRWDGPPGELGDSDYVFSMRVIVKPSL
jgi:hypothetical protein